MFSDSFLVIIMCASLQIGRVSLQRKSASMMKSVLLDMEVVQLIKMISCMGNIKSF